MYNAEKHIDNCLESLISQNIEKEIILIDDGSNDRTYIIAEEYEKKYRYIKLLHQENKGQSSARNRGVSIAKGEYIFFCDSDDYIEENSLSILYDYCKKYNLDILKTGWKTKKEDKIITNLPKENSLIMNNVMSAKDFFKKTIFNWYNVVPWNGMFKLSFLEKNKIIFPEGIQFEDNLYHLKVSTIDLNARIMLLNNTFYIANINENSTTTSFVNPKKIYDQLENIRLMNAYIETIADIEIKELARVAVSSLTFTMTSYYYRLNRYDKKEVNKKISKKILKSAIKYPQNKFQKYKIWCFTYCRAGLNIYEYFHMRRKTNV